MVQAPGWMEASEQVEPDEKKAQRDELASLSLS